MSRLKKSSFLSKLMFFLGLLLLWSLMKSFWEFKGAYRRIDEARKVFEKEVVKNRELKDKLGEVKKKEYVERIIRNELNMRRDGEVVVVLPDDDRPPNAVSRQSETKGESKNWEKWWSLLK